MYWLDSYLFQKCRSRHADFYHSVCWVIFTYDIYVWYVLSLLMCMLIYFLGFVETTAFSGNFQSTFISSRLRDWFLVFQCPFKSPLPPLLPSTHYDFQTIQFGFQWAQSASSFTECINSEYSAQSLNSVLLYFTLLYSRQSYMSCPTSYEFRSIIPITPSFPWQLYLVGLPGAKNRHRILLSLSHNMRAHREAPARTHIWRHNTHTSHIRCF